MDYQQYGMPEQSNRSGGEEVNDDSQLQQSTNQEQLQFAPDLPTNPLLSQHRQR